MTDKSHVSLEQKVCAVCGVKYGTDAILLDRRLRDSLDPKTVTGWGMCPEHVEMIGKGFVILVECDPTKSVRVQHGGNLDTAKPADVTRTGNVAYLHESIFTKVFNIPGAPPNKMCFIDPEVFAYLKTLQGDKP